MSDLDLVRDLFPERVSDATARERVRAAVAAGTFERRPPVWRRPRLFFPAAGTTALVGAAIAVFLVAGTDGTSTAAAARVLRQAAVTARAQRSLATLDPGQYLYTKSTSEYLNTVAVKTGTYAVLVPYVREIWLRRDGTG